MGTNDTTIEENLREQAEILVQIRKLQYRLAALNQQIETKIEEEAKKP